jgi:hypothetical protein
MEEDAPTLSLRTALAQDRLEEFVRAAEARGVEFTKGSEFERGLALLMVQRSREQRRHSAVSA